MASSHQLRPSMAANHVLCINTGGTISSLPSSGGYTITNGTTFNRILLQNPLICKSQLPDRVSGKSSLSEYGTITSFVAPIPSPGSNGEDLEVDLLELKKLLPSPEIGIEEYALLYRIIATGWNDYKGFVILHGTDTMAYTSSFLNYLFATSGKPIILTGSQIPLSVIRSDGWFNLLESLIAAGTLQISGVGLLFHHKLFAGARVTKASPNLLAGFESPMERPLAEFNVNIDVAPHALPLSASSLSPTPLSLKRSTRIQVSHLYPGLKASSLFSEKCDGLVLVGYGAGNVPMGEELGFLGAIKEAVARGIVVVVVSQCSYPMVLPLYPFGQRLLALGVVPGHDMTLEAAYTKLLWICSHDTLRYEDKQKLFETSVGGDLTMPMTRVAAK